MAPTPPTRRPLTAKGLPRKKPGPVPKPLSERLKNKPIKQIRRVERSYTRERKIEVLMYLLNHRIPDNRHRRQVPRSRVGQSHEQDWTQSMVRNEAGQYVWYRAPTYAEASEFWKIPTPTIQGWWDSRKKLLKGTGIELPETPAPQEAPSNQDQPREAAPGAAEDRRNGPPPAENPAPLASAPGPAPSPNQTQDPPISNPAPPLSAARGPPSPTRIETQLTPPTQPAPTPTAVGQDSLMVNGSQAPVPPTVQAPPAAQPPIPQALPTPQAPPAPQALPVVQTPVVAKPPRIKSRPTPSLAPPPPLKPARLAPRPPPPASPPPSTPHPAQQPVAHAGPPHPPQLHPAADPANYVVVYVGSHPGPFPEQPVCLPPGSVLPVVYSGQPLNVPPVTYVTVFPSHPPVPYGAQPPRPHATYQSPYPPVYPGQHPPPHGPGPRYPGPHGAHPPPYHGQPYGAYPPQTGPPHPHHMAPSQGHFTHAPDGSHIQPPYKRPAHLDRPCPPPKFLEKLLPPVTSAGPPQPPPPAAHEPPTPLSAGGPRPSSPTAIAAQAQERRAAGLLSPDIATQSPAMEPPSQPPPQPTPLSLSASPDQQQQPSATGQSPSQGPPSMSVAGPAIPAEDAPGHSQAQEGDRMDIDMSPPTSMPRASDSAPEAAHHERMSGS